MSTAQFLKQFKALSPRQRAALLKSLARAASPKRTKSTRNRARKFVRWPDVQARTRCILPDRILPNLVLVEREELST